MNTQTVNKVLTTAGAAGIVLGGLAAWNSDSWVGFAAFAAGIVALVVGIQRSRV